MRIIAKTFKLPSGITVKHYFKTVEEQVSNLLHSGNDVPKITIKPKEVPKITIKPHEPVQSSSTMKITRKDTAQVSGADILAEQNKAMINTRTASGFTIKSNSGITRETALDAEYNRLATGINGTNTLDNVNRLKSLFEQDTGLILHCPANRTNLFGMALSAISKDVKQGIFPKDIKHVLIGHGMGSSLPSKTGIIGWELEDRSFAGGKPVNIFEYINKNIPKGEKVLVCSCEEGATIANRAGIGRHVELSLSVPTEPAKIVRAGENKIIGHYTSYDSKFPETGVVYYSLY